VPAVDLRPVRGTRVVAERAALDAAAVPDGAVVLRLAPDEALVLGDGPVTVAADPHAVVVSDHGWSAAALSWRDFDHLVRPHIEWHVHEARGLAQGRVANVPAKLWMTESGVLLVTATCHAHELTERLR
jgi:hypothetical protein